MKTITFTLFFLIIGFSTFAQEHAKAVVKYAVDNLGKKIDRGECWDLVAFALDNSGATWSMPFDFGDQYDYKSETIQVGDIISFDGVRFENDQGYTTFPMHYAIVHEVIDKNKIVIIHQNHNNKKVVQTLEINLADLKKGTMQFYRVRE